ncbi:uncharacterized protein [Pyxicephalus adspersus]|uniref:uncharacterized protein isoform X2 n=1 Tax=Pyxicephalus adspersus TaxID=30357 RepID=UPI003B59D7DC
MDKYLGKTPPRKASNQSFRQESRRGKEVKMAAGKESLKTMIMQHYDQQFLKRAGLRRGWQTGSGPQQVMLPTVGQIQHTWSDMKRRRVDLVCEVGDRILSANSPSRSRLLILQRPHRRLAVPQDVEEEEPAAEEQPSTEEETAAQHQQPESSDEGEEAAKAEEIASSSPLMEAASPPEEVPSPPPPPPQPQLHGRHPPGSRRDSLSWLRRRTSATPLLGVCPDAIIGQHWDSDFVSSKYHQEYLVFKAMVPQSRSVFFVLYSLLLKIFNKADLHILSIILNIYAFLHIIKYSCR